MTIKCRFRNEDCDKALYICPDCKVIVDFIKEARASLADTRSITWLGQALELLEQVVNVNPVTKKGTIERP